MKTYKRLVTGLLIGLASLSPASAYANGSLFDVMRGMVTGMALLGQLANAPNTSRYAQPWRYYPPPPGAFSAPGAYQPPQNNPLLQKLQGSWYTDNGELLVVNGNYARLYRSRTQYQDLQIRIDAQFIWIAPSGHRQAKQYQHRLLPDRFALRDAQNKTLEFKRYQGRQ